MLELVGLFVVFIVGIYHYIRYKQSYWRKKGVEHLKPHLLYGNMPKLIQGKENFIIEMMEISSQIKGRFGGMYFATSPAVLIKDPDLIKQIMIKDFEIFPDRGWYIDEKVDPLTGNLFTYEIEKWRHMRSKLSPTFTSGKLKQMVPIFITIGQRLQKHVDDAITNANNQFEARELMSRYTVDAITSLAFGIEIDCINNPDDMFRKISQRIADPPKSRKQFFRQVFMLWFPKIAKYFEIRSTDDEVEKFFKNVTEQSLDLRENKGVTRNDFMQLLVQLRNSGKLNDEDDTPGLDIKEGNLKYSTYLFHFHF